MADRSSPTDVRSQMNMKEDTLGPYGEPSVFRFFAFAVPLLCASSLVTHVAIRIGLPDIEISTRLSLVLLAVSSVVFIMLVGQNFIEGGVILVMIFVMGGAAVWPMDFNFWYPFACSIASAWIATRVHRRFCNREVWFE